MDHTTDPINIWEASETESRSWLNVQAMINTPMQVSQNSFTSFSVIYEWDKSLPQVIDTQGASGLVRQQSSPLFNFYTPFWFLCSEKHIQLPHRSGRLWWLRSKVDFNIKGVDKSIHPYKCEYNEPRGDRSKVGKERDTRESKKPAGVSFGPVSRAQIRNWTTWIFSAYELWLICPVNYDKERELLQRTFCYWSLLQLVMRFKRRGEIGHTLLYKLLSSPF